MAEENEKLNDEQIFNEDELQDIMSEFEDLEREYNEHEMHEVAQVVDEAVNDNVVSLHDQKKTIQTPAQPVGPGQGVTMTLEMPIGDQVAQIEISPEYGFSLVMDGVELTIDATNGCAMTLPGGMTFNIPLSNPVKQKKSA